MKYPIEMMFTQRVSIVIVVVVTLIGLCEGQTLLHNPKLRRFPLMAATKLKNRVREKLNQYKQRNMQMICYDMVGCFQLPHKNSPLQKVPEDPKLLNTKFFLFTRKLNFSNPEVLYYDDEGKSLSGSSFNPKNSLKVMIHGYMSKWNEKGALKLTDAYLKLYDCNVILIDWKIGARGPQYTSAAANTEIVGRQLGILLMKMLENGLNPKDIHLIGFSLGAHVAGSASESLKKQGHLMGRITGLDAASPLFRSNYFREEYKKLDKGDAEFVDVIHTDSSPFVTDGFGIWQPIGHVDFFPNGGQEQPGCSDPRSSVVRTHLERGLTRDTACSHIRAFHLFIESLMNKLNNAKGSCEFTAFSCPGGLQSYDKGLCFPQMEQQNSPLALDHTYRTDIGKFGEDVKGEGIMYFTTRETNPFCGTQIQASVQISQKTIHALGILQLQLYYLNNTVNFQIKCEIRDLVMSGTTMNGLAVAAHDTLHPKQVKNITAKINYLDLRPDEDRNVTSIVPRLYIDRVAIRDMHGNSWQYCKKDTIIEDATGKHYDLLKIELSSVLC